MKRTCLVLALLLVTGCAGPKAAPVSPAAPAAQPAPAEAPAAPAPAVVPTAIAVAITPEYEGEGCGHLMADEQIAPGEAAVPADEFTVVIKLAPTPSYDWLSQIRLEGPGTQGIKPEWFGKSWEYRVPAGKPGDNLVLTIPATSNKGETTYRLRRADLPRATLELLSGDRWVSVDPDAIYPRGAATLRLRFPRPMNRDDVVKSLRTVSPTDERRAPEGITLSWADDATLVLRLQAAVPVLALSLGIPHAADGLPLVGEVPVVHFGPAPYFAAVNPTTGAERRLGDAPPELWSAALSADGSKALVGGIRRLVGGCGDRYPDYMVDVATGRRQDVTDSKGGFQFFSANGSMRELQLAASALALSPEHGRVAGLAAGEFEKNHVQGKPWLLDLVIWSDEGKKLGTVPAFAWAPSLRHGNPSPSALVWSPDGLRVATISQDPGGARLVIADLSTRSSQVVATLPAEVIKGGIGPFDWNGSRFLVGGYLLDSAGKVEQRLLPGTFNSDGQWILHVEKQGFGSWGEISVISVASGAGRPLGAGLFAGWLPGGEALVIRWDNWRDRWVGSPGEGD